MATRVRNHLLTLQNKAGSLEDDLPESANALHQANGHLSIMKANSLSLRDVERQKSSPDMSEFVSDDPVLESFFRQNSGKSRRISKSLPELRGLRHFPMVTTQYNTVEESDEDDDGSIIMNDIPSAMAWASKSDFIFTGIGLALGLNNIWRFPYFCYNKDGGIGSFLFAYIVVLFLCGFPILVMEYSMGQLTRRGPIAGFGSLCPLLKGVPLVAAFAALLLAPMYSALNSWSLAYFFKSLYSVPQWSRCSNQWNTEGCIQEANLVPGLMTNLANESIPNPDDTRSPYIETEMEHESNLTDLSSELAEIPEVLDILNETISTIPYHQQKLLYATQQFFDLKLTEVDTETEAWGDLQWKLIMFIFITWFAVFLSLRKNILFSSHPTYCLAIVPTMLFGVMFAKAMALEGAKAGVMHFLKPTWDGIRDPEVWMYAASLCFHSIGSIIGISFAKATCNRERNNFLRDAIFICLINVGVVMLIGCTVYATLGSLALRRNMDISSVIVNDPSVAFVVYTELLSTMPFTSLWSVAFFFIVFCIGCDYQISVVAAFLVAIEDAYGLSIKKTFLSHQFFIIILCLLSFAASLVYTTQKGTLMIQLTDQYVTVLLTLILAFFEVILIGWFYGGQNLSQVIKLKVSKNLGLFFPFSWNIIAPFTILGILGWNGYYYREPLFRNSVSFPFTMQLIVHLTVIILLLVIPVIAYHQVKKTPNTNIIIRILNACKPKEEQAQSQILEMNGLGSRKPSSVMFDRLQVNVHPGVSVTPSFRASQSLLKCPVTISLIQGLDRETDL
ncbi:Sodium- and chloride-dependent GABA transporter ine [Halotydeus destructor]|nr:Sodium- and chloride-dependent GABA transporter ine [Halotydeus destructor]